MSTISLNTIKTIASDFSYEAENCISEMNKTHHYSECFYADELLARIYRAFKVHDKVMNIPFQDFGIHSREAEPYRNAIHLNLLSLNDCYIKWFLSREIK